MPQDTQVGAHPEFQTAGMRERMVEHYGSVSYSTANKDILQPSYYNMEQIAAVIVCGASVTNATGAIYGDVRAIKAEAGPYGTWKLIWYSDVAGTEVVNTTDISGKRVVLRIIGN